MIERDDILDKLTYIEALGEFYWRNPSKYHKDLAGKIAGCARANHSGKIYWYIKINGAAYKRGHLVYFIHHNRWPKPCLDHINGNSEDDRILNIREATVEQNAWNHKRRKKKSNTPMGVRKIESGRFMARIAYKHIQITLGTFDTAEEAKLIYDRKRKELYRDFA